MTSALSSQIDVFDVLPSTQTLALDRLRNGDTGSGWIRAIHQTDGVGRRGRVWLGTEGNLMASWYGTLTVPIQHVTQLAFVAALAVADLVRPLLVNQAGLTIKWPNDVLYQGQKLCGILVQSEPLESVNVLGVVIGVGLNVQSAPGVEAYETTALNIISGHTFSVQGLLNDLAVCFDNRLKSWKIQGFDQIAEDWLALAHGRDKLIRVELPENSVSGTLKGLNVFGALEIVSIDGRVYSLTGGDISYHTPMESQ